MDGEQLEAFAAQTEFMQAFYGIGGLLAGYLIGAGIADRDEMVEQLKALAESAGHELAKITKQPATPNQYMTQFAGQLPKLGAPFTVIQGGKPDDDTPPAA